MNVTPPLRPTDRECLAACPRRAGAESFQPLVERYLALVYSSALRRTGAAVHATEVTRAVFLVLARRARKLRRKTVLAGWLFHITALTCRKLPRPRRWFWSRRPSRPPVQPDAPLWTRVAPELDTALDRWPPRQRDAWLLLHLLNFEIRPAAAILRTSERRAGQRAAAGLKKLAKRLRKSAGVDSAALALTCSAEGCAAPIPEGLASDILQSIEASRGRRPALQLARRTLNSLAWTRWRRRLVIGIPSFILLLVILAGLAWRIDARTGHSRSIATFLVWSVRHEAKRVPGLAAPPRIRSSSEDRFQRGPDRKSVV